MRRKTQLVSDCAARRRGESVTRRRVIAFEQPRRVLLSKAIRPFELDPLLEALAERRLEVPLERRIRRLSIDGRLLVQLALSHQAQQLVHERPGGLERPGIQVDPLVGEGQTAVLAGDLGELDARARQSRIGPQSDPTAGCGQVALARGAHRRQRRLPRAAQATASVSSCHTYSPNRSNRGHSPFAISRPMTQPWMLCWQSRRRRRACTVGVSHCESLVADRSPSTLNTAVPTSLWISRTSPSKYTPSWRWMVVTRSWRIHCRLVVGCSVPTRNVLRYSR